MNHGAFIKLVFHDGLSEHGAYNSFNSTPHWIALAGFMRRFTYNSVHEIFVWKRTHWECIKGPRLGVR